MSSKEETINPMVNIDVLMKNTGYFARFLLYD